MASTYKIVLRQGLPSAVGETLLRNADYDIYVRDRAPQVHFTGKNYVLPRVGQEGIPVVSVNTRKIADHDHSRRRPQSSADRALGGFPGAAFRLSRSSNMSKTTARRSGPARFPSTSELNHDVTTAFPVLEALGKLQAGRLYHDRQSRR